MNWNCFQNVRKHMPTASVDQLSFHAYGWMEQIEMYGIWRGSTSFAKDTAWLKKPWWPWECASQLSSCLRHLGSLSVQGPGSCTLKFSLLLVPMGFAYTAPCHSSQQGYWGEHVPGRCGTPLMSNFGLRTHRLTCLTFLGTEWQSETPPHSLPHSLEPSFFSTHFFHQPDLYHGLVTSPLVPSPMRVLSHLILIWCLLLRGPGLIQ